MRARISLLSLLFAAVVLPMLSACDGDRGSKSKNEPDPPPTTTPSGNWDQLTWDQGQWN
jgi:hypothetical protein